MQVQWAAGELQREGGSNRPGGTPAALPTVNWLETQRLRATYYSISVLNFFFSRIGMMSMMTV